MATSVTLVGIAGASGSGKTTLAEGLKAALQQAGWPQTTLLGEDAYYRDQAHLALSERATQNYDDPAALDHDLMVRQLEQLAAGRPIDQPVYDYSRHTRAGQTIPLEPSPIILVEGLFVLSAEPLRRTLDLGLFVETSPDLCLLRRLRRDIRERGRTADSVLAQYEATVRPGYLRHVAPSRAHADVIIDGTGSTSTMIDQGWQALTRALTRATKDQ